ncbi:MAG: lytic transglycosylase [Mucilaginibacter sp.]|nr:lytic transglycosylase [Mucilaginibacter sp.]
MRPKSVYACSQRKRMKRFLIFATGLLSLQIVKAHSLLATDSSSRVARGNYSQKIAQDTVLALPLSIYSTSIFKLRLDSIQKDVQLDYNEYVQNYIDLYTRHKEEMGRVMGLSKYYFPIYEKIFREAGIPVEIKYLSIVESKLDPNAVSRVGATGPWQFMATTAKMYGLNMDSYVDERRDPIQASYAAAAYLKDAYQEFGDWLLAIASYNCGKSNVERAVQKAGAMDFWSIRQYLPPETRNYVPAYIAVSYVMNYAGKHNIITQNWNFSARADTVMVDKFIALSNVARALNVDLSDLALLNPSYKRQIVNGTTALPRRLVIPYAEKRNYNALYDVLNNTSTPAVVQPELQIVPAARAVSFVDPVNAVKPAGVKPPDYYTVKEGETLENIAADYGLDIREIKAWNHLQSNKAIVGKKLKLNPFAKISRG